jgi:hypothetical protein
VPEFKAPTDKPLNTATSRSLAARISSFPAVPRPFFYVVLPDKTLARYRSYCCQDLPSFYSMRLEGQLDKANYSTCHWDVGYDDLDFHGQGKSLAGRDHLLISEFKPVKTYAMPCIQEIEGTTCIICARSKMVPLRHTWILWPSHARSLAILPLFTSYCIKGNSFFIHFTVLTTSRSKSDCVRI